MIICPVIKCKAEGKYIIGMKLKSIIKQGNNLILKQGVSGSAECFKEYIGKNAKDQCYKIMNLIEEKKQTFTQIMVGFMKANGASENKIKFFTKKADRQGFDLLFP